jgi:hypothetical protein
MQLRWIAIALAASAVAAAQPAEAAKAAKAHYGKRHAHIAKVQCRDTAHSFSWSFLWEFREPRWNGCSPPVYEYGQFVGQDPDSFIRLMLRRNPKTGNYPGY